MKIITIGPDENHKPRSFVAEISEEEKKSLEEQRNIPLPPDNFVKGRKNSLILFKKRIKEFPFMKKQPRFKKVFFIEKTITREGKENFIKYKTDYELYKEKKEIHMQDIFGDYDIPKGAKILGAYWTCPKYIYHPKAVDSYKENDSKWYRTDLYDDSSFMPLKIIPAALPENVKRKKIDTCRGCGGQFLLPDFPTSLIHYCLGKTDKKPDLTGYVIRK